MGDRPRYSSIRGLPHKVPTSQTHDPHDQEKVEFGIWEELFANAIVTDSLRSPPSYTMYKQTLRPSSHSPYKKQKGRNDGWCDQFNDTTFNSYTQQYRPRPDISTRNGPRKRNDINEKLKGPYTPQSPQKPGTKYGGHSDGRPFIKKLGTRPRTSGAVQQSVKSPSINSHDYGPVEYADLFLKENQSRPKTSPDDRSNKKSSNNVKAKPEPKIKHQHPVTRREAVKNFGTKNSLLDHLVKQHQLKKCSGNKIEQEPSRPNSILIIDDQVDGPTSPLHQGSPSPGKRGDSHHVGSTVMPDLKDRRGENGGSGSAPPSPYLKSVRSPGKRKGPEMIPEINPWEEVTTPIKAHPSTKTFVHPPGSRNTPSASMTMPTSFAGVRVPKEHQNISRASTPSKINDKRLFQGPKIQRTPANNTPLFIRVEERRGRFTNPELRERSVTPSIGSRNKMTEIRSPRAQTAHENRRNHSTPTKWNVETRPSSKQMTRSSTPPLVATVRKHRTQSRPGSTASTIATPTASRAATPTRMRTSESGSSGSNWRPGERKPSVPTVAGQAARTATMIDACRAENESRKCTELVVREVGDESGNQWFALQRADANVTLRQAAIERTRRRATHAGGIPRSNHRAFSEEAEKIILKWINGLISGRMAWVQFSTAVELFDGMNGEIITSTPLSSLVGAPLAVLQSEDHILYKEVFSKSPQEIQEIAWMHVMEEADKMGTRDELLLTLKRIAMRAKGQGKEAYCKVQIWRILLENEPQESFSSSSTGTSKSLKEEDIQLNGDGLLMQINKLSSAELKNSIENIEIYLAQVMSSKRQLSGILRSLEQTNHYEILGLAPDCSDEEIKRAFTKLARTHHPDKGGHADTFTQIHQAYQSILTKRETGGDTASNNAKKSKESPKEKSKEKTKSADTNTEPSQHNGSDTSNQKRLGPKEKAIYNITAAVRLIQKEAEACSKVAMLGLQSTVCIGKATKMNPSLTLKAARHATEITSAVSKHASVIGEFLKNIAHASKIINRDFQYIADKLIIMGDGAIDQSQSLVTITARMMNAMDLINLDHTKIYQENTHIHPTQMENIQNCVDKVASSIRICASAATDSAEAAMEVMTTITVREKRVAAGDNDSSDGEESAQDEAVQDKQQVAETEFERTVTKRIRLATLVRQADAALRVTQAKVKNLLENRDMLHVEIQQKEFIFILCAEILDEGCFLYDKELRAKDNVIGWLNIILDSNGPFGFLQEISGKNTFTINPDLRVQLIQLACAIDLEGFKKLLQQAFDRMIQTVNWLKYRPRDDTGVCPLQIPTPLQMKKFEEWQKSIAVN